MPEAAPFDASSWLPQLLPCYRRLREQLAPDGRMVLPVGMQEQWLYLIERDASGFRETRLEAVKFVPLLLGRHETKSVCGTR